MPIPTTRRCSKCGNPLAADGDCPICALKGALALSGQASEARVIEQAGDQIGRYKLLEKIGEGGYGIVYLAEQSEPIRRRVALKIVKLGMDTRQVIARFEAERQALALMDHPNIAKVLDAGATDTGRPYFVMELVQGIRITDYCDQHNLSTRQRLDLFIQVCQAVQHAHQKGIIHRDLKPSNVLVAELDSLAVPKVIDFGIAKATGQQLLTDRTLFTAFQQFIGTPAYMSPEQAGMSGADIDTRSDIYSLGVLLYELLTSHLPFEQKDLLQAGFDEMRRIIWEKEPQKPSTRLATALASAPRSALRTPQLKEVRGDLDWIVMRCLEKDRIRRYETASELAQDIERHLNDEPVTAGAPGPAYRISKFVRRHRSGFATATAILLLLIAGVVVSTWQAVRATKAEKQANAARADADRQRDNARQAQSEEARQRKAAEDAKAQTELQLKLTEQERERAQQAEKQANAAREDADLQRDKARQAQADEAKQRKAAEEAKAATELQLKLTEQEKEKANAASAEANLQRDNARQAQAEEAKQRKAADQAELQLKLTQQEKKKTQKAENTLSTVIRAKGDLRGAEGLYRQALEEQGRAPDKENPETLKGLQDLATSLLEKNDAPGAERLYQRVLEGQKKVLGNEHLEVACTLDALAVTLVAQGKLWDAETLFQQSVEMHQKTGGANHPHVAPVLKGLVELVLKPQHKTNEMVAAYRAAAERGNAVAQCKLAGLYQTGEGVPVNPKEALKWYRQAAEQHGQAGQRGHAEAINNLARLGGGRGDTDEALNGLARLLATCPLPEVRDGRQAVEAAEKAVAATKRKDHAFLDTLAAAYAEAGNFQEAVSTQREALALAQEAKTKNAYRSRLKLYESNQPYREAY
jgi:eukaryotic-like serine/threonine-protein kinase